MSRPNDKHIPAYSQDLIDTKLHELFPLEGSDVLVKLSDRELGLYFGQRSVVEKLTQLLEADRQEK